MSFTGVDAFDTSIHKTNHWLKQISGSMGWEDPHRAYLGLRSVLHTLRDRLPVQEVAQLGAQLPMVVRGFYYEGWKARARVPKEIKEELKTRGAFLNRVRQEFPLDADWDAERLVRSVFQLLEESTTGEMEDVRDVLPEDLRALFPAARGAKNEAAVAEAPRSGREAEEPAYH